MGAGRLIDDPRHWYDRGARMRLLADDFEDMEIKTAMLELADDYDVLGDRAAERALGRRPSEIRPNERNEEEKEA
jgi:hypothetical protein